MNKKVIVEKIAQLQADLDNGLIDRRSAEQQIVQMLIKNKLFPKDLFELDELIMAEIERKKEDDGQHKKTV